MRSARSPRLWDHLRRALIAFVALMLASTPTTMTFANSIVPDHHTAASGDVASGDMAVWLDDTPDLGNVRDAPPPVIGAMNLYLTGVLPAVEVVPISVRLVRQPWPHTEAASAASHSPLGLKRPPKA